MASSKKTQQKFMSRAKRQATEVNIKGKEHIKRNLIGRLSHIENIRLLIFEWTLLVSALILLAVTQAFWFVDSYAENSYTDGGTYSEATIGAVNSLNPLFAVTSSEKDLSRLLFATLATVDYSGHPGIGLARSITSSDNGQTWTVELRDGLKWSDGAPITNDDVLWTVKTIQNPNIKTIYDANLYNVEVAENESGEIVFTLPRPYADFVSALEFPILPKHVLENADIKTLAENNFSRQPVTSGPFMFNAVQMGANSDEKVYYLTYNPNYYEGAPYLQSFAIHTYPSKEALIAALNSGVVTATAELSDAESERITNSQLVKQNTAVNSGVYLFFNTASPQVSNKNLRAAIRQGLDLERIRQAAETNDPIPSVTPLDYPLLESQISSIDFPALPEHDFAAAKAKISELTGASSSDSPAAQPILEIATVSSGYMPDVANEIASQLRDLGFQANVTVHEEQDQDFITKRTYDLLVFEIGLGADPDLLPYYHSTHATTSGLNLSNYKNALVDDLLLGAREGLDDTLRAKKYDAFLNYWVSDVPAIGLYQSNLTYYYNRNARSYGSNIKLVDSLDRFTDVENWAVNKTTKNFTP